MASKIDHLANAHGHGCNPTTREIFLHGEATNDPEIEPGVEYMMAARIIKNLHLLRYASPNLPVMIHMSTIGGEWGYGMAIYDAIRAMPYHITIVGYAHARSMASIILQAADHRVLMPNSCFMLHHGTTGYEGEVPTVQAGIAWETNEITPRMLDIYVEAARGGIIWQGWSDEEIRAELVDKLDHERDIYLTPDEVVDWGMCDCVWERWE